MPLHTRNTPWTDGGLYNESTSVNFAKARSKRFQEQGLLLSENPIGRHSHSMVLGGFELMS